MKTEAARAGRSATGQGGESCKKWRERAREDTDAEADMDIADDIDDDDNDPDQNAETTDSGSQAVGTGRSERFQEKKTQAAGESGS